jgi:hypothetical protein
MAIGEMLVETTRLTILLVTLWVLPCLCDPLGTVQIVRSPQGPVVPKDFIGLSIQQSVALADFGSSASGNTVLFRLMKNLGVGTLRIGGAAADSACWNGEAAPTPSICQYTVTATDFESWAFASAQTGWPLLIGVSLAQNESPGAPQYILDEVTRGLLPALAVHPRASLLAIELGNEINLYYLNPAYRTSSYGVQQQASDLLSYMTVLKNNASTQNIALAAPAYFSPSLNAITSQLEPLISSVLTCGGCNPQNLGIVTLHEYFLNHATGDRTIPQLLSATLMHQVQAVYQKAVGDLSSLYNLRVQIDETNSSSPDPGVTGVCDVQASALWALDYALDMARFGVRGMNFHIHAGSYYDPIVINSSGPGLFSNQVQPEYYAMYAFNAAKGQQFLPLTISSSANIRAYALSKCSTCAISVYLINKDLTASGEIQVSLSAPATSATYFELSASSLASPASGIFYGGVQFDNSTGLLTAPPQRTTIQADASGNYTVLLDNAAAGILTIQP